MKTLFLLLAIALLTSCEIMHPPYITVTNGACPGIVTVEETSTNIIVFTDYLDPFESVTIFTPVGRYLITLDCIAPDEVDDLLMIVSLTDKSTYVSVCF